MQQPSYPQQNKEQHKINFNEMDNDTADLIKKLVKDDGNTIGVFNQNNQNINENNCVTNDNKNKNTEDCNSFKNNTLDFN